MSKDWKEHLIKVSQELKAKKQDSIKTPTTPESKNIASLAKLRKRKKPETLESPQVPRVKVVKASNDAVTVIKSILTSTQPWYKKQLAVINKAGRSASMISVLGSVVNPELLERINDIETLVKEVHSVCAKACINNRKAVTSRRNAETVINYATTVRGALKNADINSAHLPEISTQMQTYLRELKASLQQLGHDARVMPSLDSINGEAIKHFAQSEVKLRRDAQANINKIAFMIELPVVPIFEGIVTPEMLSNTGLQADKLSGYPVLLKQRLIALRTALMDEKGLDRGVYLKRVIARIEEHSPQKWTLVSETGMANVRHELFFYWIMPEKTLNAMSFAAKGSALREWGLAF